MDTNRRSDEEDFLVDGEVSRRTVLKAAGAASLGVAASGLLGGVSGAATANQKKRLVTQGITKSSVKVGQTIALTGPLAGQLGLISAAEAAYFSFLNDDQGGANGRRIDFTVLDDAFDEPRALTNFKRLTEQEEVFLVTAITPGEGSASIAFMKKSRIPFLVSGSQRRFESPKRYPNFLNNIQSFYGNGKVLGEHLLENFPNAKIGILKETSAIGEDPVLGLRDALGSKADSMIVAEESYSPIDQNADVQVLTLRDSGADVWFENAIAPINIAALRTADEIGWEPKQVYLTLLSSGANQLAAVPPGIVEGAVGAFVTKDPADPEWANDSAVEQYKSVMSEYAPEVNAEDPAALEYGYVWGMIAAKLLTDMEEPTAKAFITAGRQLRDYDLEGLALPGVTIGGSKTTNSMVPLAVLGRWTGSSWETFGEPVSLV